jgi:hypothetical protein
VSLEIRCCCVPRKLLGWVDVPEHLARAGEVVRFHLREPVLLLAPPPGHYFRVPAKAPQFLALQIDRYRENEDGPWPLLPGPWRLAVKSHEHPIELLRRIPTFTVNPWPDGARAVVMGFDLGVEPDAPLSIARKT